MRTYEEIYASAIEKRAFSNGTMWEIWSSAWCDRCIHERPARKGRDDKGCPLVTVGFLGRTPIEWLPGEPDRPDGWHCADMYHCIEFRSEDDGRGRELRPRPTPPGQGELIPRAPYTGTRMWVSVANEGRPAEVRR